MAFDGIVFDEAIAAVDLHRFAGRAGRGLGRVQFRHGRLAAKGLSQIRQLGRPQHQQPGRIQLHRHVGEHELDGLVLGQPLGKRPALRGVGDAVVERCAADAYRHGPDADAPAFQHAHRLTKPLPFRADEGLRRHLAIVKDDFRGIARAQAELILFLTDPQAGRGPLDDERRNTVTAGQRIGHGQHNIDACHAALRHECLGAVEDPPTPTTDRARLDRGGVAAGGRLGQAPPAQRLPLRQRGKVAALLLGIPEEENVAGAQGVVRRDREANGCITPRHGLDCQHGADHVQLRSAVLLRNGESQQPQRRQFGDEREGKLTFPVPRRGVWLQFGRRKRSYGPMEDSLVFSEFDAQ